MSNRKQRLILMAVMAILFLMSLSASAQSSGSDDVKVKNAASQFFREYLRNFDYPFGNERKQLSRYLSPRLIKLIRYELQRMKAWSAKNPDLKPPVVEDLFTCNHYEPPHAFHVGKPAVRTDRGTAVIGFAYAEQGKIIDRCKVIGIFINHHGRWLLDNVRFDKDVDLIKLLSRKEYTVLPK